MTDNNQPPNLTNITSEVHCAQLQHELLQAKSSLLEKERIVQVQNILLRQQLDELRKKQLLKEEMLVFFYIFRPVLLPLMWLIRPIYRGLKPRIGVLNQYPPRELQIPAKCIHNIPPRNQPRISIVTPSFNQGAFIERTINSVLSQSYQNLEYYVQDGGSKDGTVEILGRYAAGLTGWESSPDKGQSQAINLGFSKTSGEIMAWLNSDDLLLPGTLAYVAQYFNCHPEVDVVYGHRIIIDESDRQIGHWIMPMHDDAILSWADFIPQETMFWRRAIWEKAGGRIDESYHFAMDWDLLVRFREAGARFVRLPRFLGGFRVHQRQKTSAEISEVGILEMGRIQQRLLGRIPTSDETQKAVFWYLLKHVAANFWWQIRSKLGFK